MARGKGFTGFSALALALVATPAALLAQSSTSSALTGLVRDSTGSPLAGATIRVASPALIGGEKVMRSMANGTYRFPVLPPGRYRIVVEASGQTPLTGSEHLELGRTSTVNWKFQSAASATVEVTASSSANLDSAPVGVTANYSTTELATLPTERSLTGIMNLTPGVNSNHAWGGDTRENAFMMDGINISDPQSNTQWIFPNPDWFSEIQVGGIGSPAEFGGFTGGFVNGIIKRGGNELTGNFSGYYGDNKWEARPTNSRFTAEEKILPPAKDWDMAISVGGPILKDKLWYFTSFERKQGETTPIGAALPVRRSDVLALVKMTWQVIPSATLEGIYEYDYLARDRRNISTYTEVDATNQQTAPNRSYGLTWLQSIGSDKVLTLKAFGYSGRNDQPGYHGEDYALDTYDPLSNGLEYFHNPSTVSYDYRGRFTVSATFDLFRSGLLTAGDNHAFRMGIEHESITDEEVQRSPGGIGLMGAVQGSGVNEAVFTDYFWTGGGWDIKERATRLSVFVQDAWTVNDRLTLRPGLRLEQQKANAYGQPTVWDTRTLAPRLGVTYAVTADQKNLLKFHWGRFFSAYSASYIDRQYQSMLPPEVRYEWGTLVSPGVVTSVQIDPTNYATWPMPGDPATWVHRLTVSGYAPTDPNAKQPYMDETTLSFEHKFKGPWAASATYVYRVNKDNLLRKDLAQDTGHWSTQEVWDYRNDPEGNNQITIPVWITSIASDQHQWLVTNIPEAKRAFWSATLACSRAFQDGWSLNASYTRARRYGNTYKSNGYDELFESPNNLINSNGLLPGFDDNEFKVHGLVELPWKMRISGAFTFLSGNHYTPYARTDRILGIRYYPNVQPRGSEQYPSERLLDLRATQIVPITAKANAEVFVEVFNVLNSGSVLAWNERMNSSDYKLPSSVEQGRRVRLGFRVNF